MRKLEHIKDATRWHLRFLEMAELVSKWSKHPDFQVGAVAVGNFGQVLSTGYNGWPRDITGEDRARQAERDVGSTPPSLTIHAETNVIYNASLTGVSLMGSTLYVFPMFPCVKCAKALVQVHVGQICYKNNISADKLPSSEEAQAKWGSSWDLAERLFREANIAITRIDD